MKTDLSDLPSDGSSLQPEPLPSGYVVDDEAVERAAVALAELEWGAGTTQTQFDRKPKSFGDRYRKAARVALEAAAPLPVLLGEGE